MADWTDIADSALDPDAPLTSDLAYAWRDNVIAQSEGSPGAPKNLGRSMDIDAGNLDGTAAITNLDNCAKLLLSATAVAISNSPTATIGYQLSADNGATWGTSVTLATSYPGSTGGGTLKACAAASAIVDMTGFNAIRLSGSGTLSGAAIWVEGA